MREISSVCEICCKASFPCEVGIEGKCEPLNKLRQLERELGEAKELYARANDAIGQVCQHKDYEISILEHQIADLKRELAEAKASHEATITQDNAVIEGLKMQIEGMKNCGNCKHSEDCDWDYSMDGINAACCVMTGDPDMENHWEAL